MKRSGINALLPSGKAIAVFGALHSHLSLVAEARGRIGGDERLLSDCETWLD